MSNIVDRLVPMAPHPQGDRRAANAGSEGWRQIASRLDQLLAGEGRRAGQQSVSREGEAPSEARPDMFAAVDTVGDVSAAGGSEPSSHDVVQSQFLAPEVGSAADAANLVSAVHPGAASREIAQTDLGPRERPDRFSRPASAVAISAPEPSAPRRAGADMPQPEVAFDNALRARVLASETHFAPAAARAAAEIFISAAVPRGPQAVFASLSPARGAENRGETGKSEPIPAWLAAPAPAIAEAAVEPRETAIESSVEADPKPVRRGGSGADSGLAVAASEADIAETSAQTRLPGDQVVRVSQAVVDDTVAGRSNQNAFGAVYSAPTAPATSAAVPEALHAPARRLHLQLEPEHLGTVEIELRSGPEGLSIRIAAESEETVRMLRADAELVGELVRSAGREVESVSVHLLQADRPAPVDAQMAGQRGPSGSTPGDAQLGERGQPSGDGHQRGDGHQGNNHQFERRDAQDDRGGADRRGLYV